MPNGGVPMNLLLRPSGSDSHVIFCQGATMKVIAKDEWDKAKRDAQACLTLNEAEAQVLERFLRYWLRDNADGPIYRQHGVDAAYDF